MNAASPTSIPKQPLQELPRLGSHDSDCSEVVLLLQRFDRFFRLRAEVAGDLPRVEAELTQRCLKGYYFGPGPRAGEGVREGVNDGRCFHISSHGHACVWRHIHNTGRTRIGVVEIEN